MQTYKQMVINLYTNRKQTVWRQSLQCSWSSSIEQYPDERQTAGVSVHLWRRFYSASATTARCKPTRCSLNCSDFLIIFHSTCQDVWTEQPRPMSWHTSQIFDRKRMFLLRCCAEHRYVVARRTSVAVSWRRRCVRAGAADARQSGLHLWKRWTENVDRRHHHTVRWCPLSTSARQAETFFHSSVSRTWVRSVLQMPLRRCDGLSVELSFNYENEAKDLCMDCEVLCRDLWADEGLTQLS